MEEDLVDVEIELESRHEESNNSCSSSSRNKNEKAEKKADERPMSFFFVRPPSEGSHDFQFALESKYSLDRLSEKRRTVLEGDGYEGGMDGFFGGGGLSHRDITIAERRRKLLQIFLFFDFFFNVINISFQAWSMSEDATQNAMDLTMAIIASCLSILCDVVGFVISCKPNAFRLSYLVLLQASVAMLCLFIALTPQIFFQCTIIIVATQLRSSYTTTSSF
mmetsp:Transcript_11483/g.19513  ORF Transcript_11483/g.19513 Transcript_11483/m.19513 type:complete len:221 (-) Transcript_11483:21-683(-)